MSSVQVSLLRQYLQKSISIISILWLAKSLSTIISWLVVEGSCWLVCLWSRNDWGIRDSLQTGTFIFDFCSGSLLLVELLELRSDLLGCSASFFTYLQLFSLVHLVKILL